jgi:hypothetical protein
MERPERLLAAAGFLATRMTGGEAMPERCHPLLRWNVCNVRLRREKRPDRLSQQMHRIATVNGREVLVDSRIVDRLPTRVPVTVRGVGRLKRLSLNLEGEEWARLLS